MTAKHVSIMSALSREVEERSLMTVSGVEQDVSCQASSPVGHYEAVSLLLRNPSIAPSDKAKLVLLYALRYDEEAPQQTSSLFGAMEGICDGMLLDTMRTSERPGPLRAKPWTSFLTKPSPHDSPVSKATPKGVENVYTQHKPAFMSVLEKAAKGRLPTSEYPFVKETEAAKAQTKGSRLIIALLSAVQRMRSQICMGNELGFLGTFCARSPCNPWEHRRSKHDSFMQDLSEVRRLEMYKTSRR
eukprot:jgi/Picre1/28913/NNA_004309.t1